MKNKSVSSSLIPHPSSLIPKIKRALRGEIDARAAALETLRRSRVRLRRWRERAMLEQLDNSPARLDEHYARMSSAELLEHFRRRTTPSFIPGFDASALTTSAELQRTLFPSETAQLLEKAERILSEHRWELMGYGELCFGMKEIDWRRDPLSGADWPPDYHAEIELMRGDGSDVRVLWELNRLGHFITLGRAYALTKDERFAAEFFAQCESWREQNPVGRGANWACAMEVALRALSLLASFELFRRSPLLDEERLLMLLALLESHGAHILRNLEFSYVATSNHYLSNVVGLLWLGLMLPELEAAREWRALGQREMFREMDTQVLGDGADYEASTGYHRFVLELFLYSFILCRANNIEIEERYWRKLRAMLEYVRAYLRPDGRAPLIGDTDGGQVLPVVQRAGDDHAYVLALGAATLDEPRFKHPRWPMPEELLWILGERGVRRYESLPPDSVDAASQAFPEAGTYLMREADLYLLFNASGSGIRGRGSHGHNDVLSLEVSACGRPFIIDPGTYVYTSDLDERQRFRSTAYHSTCEIDGEEQNTINVRLPFIIGDEAQPQVLSWDVKTDLDIIVAEHSGYERLAAPVKHRRAVEFNKRERFWLIEDAFVGRGEHVFRFRFHLAPGLEAGVHANGIVLACDKISGARLFIAALDPHEHPVFESLFASRDYGAKSPSLAACWSVRAHAPLTTRWMIVPVCASEDAEAKLELITRLQTAERPPNRLTV
ncbi:MAG TPA: alginate lyase family protein [Pyrinomonadaceae bacterium]|nr:alginate lyase family protein [Pyrinomonadaceae bacterium]